MPRKEATNSAIRIRQPSEEEKPTEPGSRKEREREGGWQSETHWACEREREWAM